MAQTQDGGGGGGQPRTTGDDYFQRHRQRTFTPTNGHIDESERAAGRTSTKKKPTFTPTPSQTITPGGMVNQPGTATVTQTPGETGAPESVERAPSAGIDTGDAWMREGRGNTPAKSGVPYWLAEAKRKLSQLGPPSSLGYGGAISPPVFPSSEGQTGSAEIEGDRGERTPETSGGWTQGDSWMNPNLPITEPPPALPPTPPPSGGGWGGGGGGGGGGFGYGGYNTNRYQNDTYIPAWLMNLFSWNRRD